MITMVRYIITSTNVVTAAATMIGYTINIINIQYIMFIMLIMFCVCVIIIIICIITITIPEDAVRRRLHRDRAVAGCAVA